MPLMKAQKKHEDTPRRTETDGAVVMMMVVAGAAEAEVHRSKPHLPSFCPSSGCPGLGGRPPAREDLFMSRGLSSAVSSRW